MPQEKRKQRKIFYLLVSQQMSMSREFQYFPHKPCAIKMTEENLDMSKHKKSHLSVFLLCSRTWHVHYNYLCLMHWDLLDT